MSALCQKCGRGLACALAEVRRDTEDLTMDGTAAHRIIARALADPELLRARREAPPAIERLAERAHWLAASVHVRYAPNATSKIEKGFSCREYHSC